MVKLTEVILAQRSGFCYGVREAIDAAKLAGKTRPTYTLGEIVHNEGVIAELKAQNIHTIEQIDDVEPGATIVIRAHGTTPEVMASAREQGLVIDGTCSWVVQEHRELAKLVEEGYSIVLLGTPGHPEVVGMLGFAPDAIVVDEEEDWPSIGRTKRMALISQSTQPPWKFEKLAAHLIGKCHELKVINTVCPVTIRRQQDMMELVGRVDMMVVVGGRASANTRELVRLCEIARCRVVQISGPGELCGPMIEGIERLGISGGTSTPIEDLRAIAERAWRLAGHDENFARQAAAEATLSVATRAYRTSSD